MDFQEGIQEIKECLSIWERVHDLDKVNIEALINHKINQLGECTQKQSATVVKNTSQALNLQGDLRDAKFHLESVKALITKLVQESTQRDGLKVTKFKEEPVFVRTSPDLSRLLAELIHGRISTARSPVCIGLQALPVERRRWSPVSTLRITWYSLVRSRFAAI